jgi:hypothetical protein
MILYAESSAVLSWLFGESSQPGVLSELRGARSVFCSRLTLVESQRAINVALALGRLSSADANSCRRLLARSARTWSILELTEAVCQRASQSFPHEPIRALDALHLASLLELQVIEPAIEPLTLDQRIRENALHFGFNPRP